ncbi:MAG TPA: amino acid-binding protein [Spirochaetota bacterium]|nr:amino acid-binding protein [Spirochaetota bacterium]
MNITQLSIFLENKPGRLQFILKILTDADVNIQTITIAELTDFGILRMIVNKPDTAINALKAEHITCSKTDVLAVAIDDKPGALLKLIDSFGKRAINIEYMYAFTDRHNNQPIMILRFEDIELAKKALTEEGYTIMKKADIHGE